MPWIDKLSRARLPDGRVLVAASFRGVAFFVESSDYQGGRRTATHEVVGGETSYSDDMGRRTPSFSVRGYVIGGDYTTQRDSLRSALGDVAGPGELVDPYYGVVTAVVESFSSRDTRDDGGMSVFSIRLRETEAEPVLPTSGSDPAALVSAAADAAQGSVLEEFESSYAVAGQPDFSVESLETGIRTSADAMRDLLSPVASTVQEAAAVSALARDMSIQAAALARSPSSLAAAVLAILDSLVDTAEDAPRDLLTALLRAYGSVGELSPALGDTAVREAERANQVAVSGLLKRLVLVSAARVAPSVDYETSDDAASDLKTMLELIDEQSVDSTTELYSAMVQMRALLVSAIPGDDLLARVVEINRAVSVPSLLLSYQLYGSVSRESDLIARNNVSDPSAMSGALTVLSL